MVLMRIKRKEIARIVWNFGPVEREVCVGVEIGGGF